MNKIAFLQGYMDKTAVWTGYTAETGASNATDKRENQGLQFGDGEQIVNEGTPPELKAYEGGGDAGKEGLPKGAIEKVSITIDTSKIKEDTATKFPNGFSQSDMDQARKAGTVNIGSRGMTNQQSIGGSPTGRATKVMAATDFASKSPAPMPSAGVSGTGTGGAAPLSNYGASAAKQTTLPAARKPTLTSAPRIAPKAAGGFRTSNIRPGGRGIL
jgi:hypothetical protein